MLGMKSMANGIILKSNTVTPIECLHYALNLPTSVVITGCDSMEILEQALEAARTFQPAERSSRCRRSCAKTASRGVDGRVRAVQDDVDLRRHGDQSGLARRRVQTGPGIVRKLTAAQAAVARAL